MLCIHVCLHRRLGAPTHACHFSGASERECRLSDNGSLHHKYFGISKGAAPNTQPHAVSPSGSVRGPCQECASQLKLSEQGRAEGHNLPSSLNSAQSPPLPP